ncbi:MAG: rubredoxin-type Fe(Cys)4 protein [Desulfocapsaceae bacterium]|nr:rubredoxin-type Fe(Cys)4 protein [Desulfocapsaceae bacterium]
MKKWKCTVCNHIHPGDEPVSVCPVCGADKSFFVEVTVGESLQAEAVEKEQVSATQTEEKQASGGERKWRCTVCGYIHTGDAPPANCPICGVDSSFFEEVTDSETSDEVPEEIIPAAEETIQAERPVPAQQAPKQFGLLGKLIINHHLHPISVHTPNGVLPIVLVFLALGMFFSYGALEKASFFNLIVVFLSMPAVLFTGYVAWQMKYRGAFTTIFKVKIVCAAIVAVLTSILVFWRIIDANIAFSGDTGSWIYLGVVGVDLAAAGVAGHIGGKLVMGK